MVSAVVFEIMAACMITSGLMVNVFIAVTNVLDWMHGRRMKPYDKLIMSLGLSRIFLLICFLFRIVNRVCKLNAYPSEVSKWIFRTIQLSFDFSNLWFMMWLCVLYYVKITIFKSTLLTRFKLSLPQMIIPIILMSSLLCFSFAFIFAFNLKETSDVMDTLYAPITVNETSTNGLEFKLLSYIFGHFVPFVVASISNFILIEMISVHIQHVKKNIGSFKTPSLDAHLSAVRSLCLMQFLNICNLIGTIFFRFDCCNSIIINISFLILTSYPTFHSVALITGNAHLKRTLFRILICVRGFKMEIPTSIYHLESKTQTSVN